MTWLSYEKVGLNGTKTKYKPIELLQLATNSYVESKVLNPNPKPKFASRKSCIYLSSLS
jgi:hypothetical protein